MALGVAILENASEETARIVAVEPEDILEVEPKLLDEARTLMGRLPIEQIDVLVVGELGKNYSGTGLDPNVIGRQRVETMPDLPTPVITRLAVLDLSHETRGNALGIGLADLTTERLVRGIDPTPMRVNSFTSNFLTRARVPLALPTDRDVIATSLATCWRIDEAEARMVLIPNTLELTTLWVTPRIEAGRRRATRSFRSRASFRPIPFDQAGNLAQEELFPESHRARRHTVLIRAVVFDLDGLMFDTEALFFRVASEALADRGKVFTPEIMKQFIGRRAAEVAPVVEDARRRRRAGRGVSGRRPESFLRGGGYGSAPDARALRLARLAAMLRRDRPRWQPRPATPTPIVCSSGTDSRADSTSCSHPKT